MSRSSLSQAIKYIKVRRRTNKYKDYDGRTLDVILAELEKLEARLMEERETEMERMVNELFTPSERDINYKNHTYKQARIKGTKY